MITTHVLDTALGRPASGVPVALEIRSGDDWRPVGRGATDSDGRLKTLLSPGLPLEPGVYRISFDTAAYFGRNGTAAVYPEVRVVFEVRAGETHFHLPLLLSPFGYTTYRGS